jgi:hypothetical protein
MAKAFNGDAVSHFLPAVLLNQSIQDYFKGKAMQGIIGLLVCHYTTPSSAGVSSLKPRVNHNGNKCSETNISGLLDP